MDSKVASLIYEALAHQAENFEDDIVDYFAVAEFFTSWRTEMKAAIAASDAKFERSRIVITVSGGVLQDVSTATDATGIEIMVCDFDDGGSDEGVSLVSMDGVEEPQRAVVAIYHGASLKSVPWPVVSDLTGEG